MRIAICDYERDCRSKLRGYIVEYKRNKRIYADIYEFENGKDLLSSELFFDLIFLGYRLPETNGLQVARELRSRNIQCGIVFVTDYPDFVFESFEVNPFRFFTKPIEKYDINTMLDSFISRQKATAPLTVIDCGEHKAIPAADIIYLEGDGKYCIIRTKTETLHSSKTLSAVLEQLPSYCFCRTHKSYAVNMFYISRFDKKQIVLTNGEKAIISRNAMPDFKKVYDDFVNVHYLKQ